MLKVVPQPLASIQPSSNNNTRQKPSKRSKRRPMRITSRRHTPALDSIAATNCQTALSTAEAEGRGADTLQKIAATNKSLIDGYQYNGTLSRNVTQDDLLAGMQSGKYNWAVSPRADRSHPSAGWCGKVEATHAIITDPTAQGYLDTRRLGRLCGEPRSGIPEG